MTAIRELPPFLREGIYIEPNTGCWLWLKDLIWNGYGRLWKEQKTLGERLVHRVVYKLLIGDIDPKLELDHKCRTRCCCNPDHVRQATKSQNSRAGYDANPAPRYKGKAFCKRGHPLNEETKYKNGGCRLCFVARRLERQT